MRTALGKRVIRRRAVLGEIVDILVLYKDAIVKIGRRKVARRDQQCGLDAPDPRERVVHRFFNTDPSVPLLLTRRRGR